MEYINSLCFQLFCHTLWFVMSGPSLAQWCRPLAGPVAPVQRQGRKIWLHRRARQVHLPSQLQDVRRSRHPHFQQEFSVPGDREGQRTTSKDHHAQRSGAAHDAAVEGALFTESMGCIRVVEVQQTHKFTNYIDFHIDVHSLNGYDVFIAIYCINDLKTTERFPEIIATPTKLLQITFRKVIDSLSFQAMVFEKFIFVKNAKKK